MSLKKGKKLNNHLTQANIKTNYNMEMEVKLNIFNKTPNLIISVYTGQAGVG